MVLDNTLKSFCIDNPHANDPDYSLQMAQAVLLFHLNALSNLGMSRPIDVIFSPYHCILLTYRVYS